MALEMTFGERIVSKLGTPREPWGIEEFLGLTILIFAVLAWLAIEYGLGKILNRLFRNFRSGDEKKLGQRDE